MYAEVMGRADDPEETDLDALRERMEDAGDRLLEATEIGDGEGY